MQETPTDQIVDNATPVLHECGRTFDVIEIGTGMNELTICILYWRRAVVVK